MGSPSLRVRGGGRRAAREAPLRLLNAEGGQSADSKDRLSDKDFEKKSVGELLKERFL